MNSKLDLFESGWVGISLAFRPDELNRLIQLLEHLRQAQHGHFHFAATDWSASVGVADIEFSIKSADESDNMAIG